MRPGLALAQRISEDVSLLEPRAWVTWQSVENYRDMLPSAENQNRGLIQVDFLTDSPGAEPIRKNKKYWTMAQYSRFIKPGDHVIHTDNVDTVAAVRPDDSSATVVYRNASDQAVPVRIDLGGFAKALNGMARPSPPPPTRTWSRACRRRSGRRPHRHGRAGLGHHVLHRRRLRRRPAAALHAAKADSLVVNQNSGKALTLAADGTSLVQKTPSSADPAQRWR